MPDDAAATLFRTWLDEHRGVVLRVARAYTLAPEDTQDLVQEILLQVWRSLPGFRGRANATTWCYRVALNTALAWQRRERRRYARQRPLPDAWAVPDPGDPAGDPAHREVVARLYDAIRRLPPPDAALVLLHLDGLNYREAADVLGISEANVGVKLTRARRALAELMKEGPHGP